MPAIGTQRAHRAALARFDAVENGTDSQGFSSTLELTNNEVDTNGAPLERREASVNILSGLLTLIGQDAPRRPTADHHPCCVCERLGRAAEPTLLDASLQPDGSVYVEDLNADDIRSRRRLVTRTWCSAARCASGAAPLDGDHYLCEEHLKVLLAQTQYLRLPVKARDWLLRGCCLDCAFECAGEVPPGGGGGSGGGRGGVGSDGSLGLLPRLTPDQVEDLQASLEPMVRRLLYPPGLSEQELAEAPFGNEVPVVRQDEEEDEEAEASGSGDGDTDGDANMDAGGEGGGEGSKLVSLPLRGRNWCFECGNNPAIYVFKLRGDLTSDRVMCPTCWVALRDARAAQRAAAAAAAGGGGGGGTAATGAARGGAAAVAAAASRGAVAGLEPEDLVLYCCLRQEMLLRLQIMIPRGNSSPAAAVPPPPQQQPQEQQQWGNDCPTRRFPHAWPRLPLPAEQVAAAAASPAPLPPAAAVAPAVDKGGDVGGGSAGGGRDPRRARPTVEAAPMLEPTSAPAAATPTSPQGPQALLELAPPPPSRRPQYQHQRQHQQPHCVALPAALLTLRPGQTLLPSPPAQPPPLGDVHPSRGQSQPAGGKHGSQQTLSQQSPQQPQGAGGRGGPAWELYQRALKSAPSATQQPQPMHQAMVPGANRSQPPTSALQQPYQQQDQQHQQQQHLQHQPSYSQQQAAPYSYQPHPHPHANPCQSHAPQQYPACSWKQCGPQQHPDYHPMRHQQHGAAGGGAAAGRGRGPGGGGGWAGARARGGAAQLQEEMQRMVADPGGWSYPSPSCYRLSSSYNQQHVCAPDITQQHQQQQEMARLPVPGAAAASGSTVNDPWVGWQSACLAQAVDGSGTLACGHYGQHGSAGAYGGGGAGWCGGQQGPAATVQGGAPVCGVGASASHGTGAGSCQTAAGWSHRPTGGCSQHARRWSCGGGNGGAGGRWRIEEYERRAANGAACVRVQYDHWRDALGSCGRSRSFDGGGGGDNGNHGGGSSFSAGTAVALQADCGTGDGGNRRAAPHVVASGGGSGGGCDGGSGGRGAGPPAPHGSAAAAAAAAVPPGSPTAAAAAAVQRRSASGRVPQLPGPGPCGARATRGAATPPAAATAAAAPPTAATIAALIGPPTPPRDEMFPCRSHPELASGKYDIPVRLPGVHMAVLLGLPQPSPLAAADSRADWFDTPAREEDVPYFEGALARCPPHLSPAAVRGGGGGAAAAAATGRGTAVAAVGGASRDQLPQLFEEDYFYMVHKEAMLQLSEVKRRQLLRLVRDHNARGGSVLLCGPPGVVHDPSDMLTDILTAAGAAEEGFRSAKARQAAAVAAPAAVGGGSSKGGETKAAVAGGRGGRDGDSDAHLQGPYPWTVGAYEWTRLGPTALGVDGAGAPAGQEGRRGVAGPGDTAPDAGGTIAAAARSNAGVGVSSNDAMGGRGSRGSAREPGADGARALRSTSARTAVPAEAGAAAAALEAGTLSPSPPPRPVRDHFYGPVQLCCMDMAHRYEHRLGTTPVSAVFKRGKGKQARGDEVNHAHPVTPALLLSYMRRMLDRYGVRNDPRVERVRQQCAALRPPAPAPAAAAAASSGGSGAARALAPVGPLAKTTVMARARQDVTASSAAPHLVAAVAAAAAALAAGMARKRSAAAAGLPPAPHPADAKRPAPRPPRGAPHRRPDADSDAGEDADDDGDGGRSGGDGSRGDMQVPLGLKVPVYPLTADDTLYLTSGELMRLAHRTLMLHAPLWLRDILNERHNDALDVGTCRPTDGGLGVFAHFANMLERPLLASELATNSHVDRSQPATLMSFAAPFAVPRDLAAALDRLRKGLPLKDYRHAQWLQCRNLIDQWRLQYPALAAAADAAAAASVAAGHATGSSGGAVGAAPAVNPLLNDSADFAAKRGSVWVIVPGIRLHQLASVLAAGKVRTWPRNHNGFFSTRYGADLDALVAACWKAGVPFHVSYHAEGDLLMPGMAAAHAVMPLHCASMKISQDFLAPSGAALRLLWELDALRQEHHLGWAAKRATRELKVRPPARASEKAMAAATAAAAAAAAVAAAAPPPPQQPEDQTAQVERPDEVEDEAQDVDVRQEPGEVGKVDFVTAAAGAAEQRGSRPACEQLDATPLPAEAAATRVAVTEAAVVAVAEAAEPDAPAADMLPLDAMTTAAAATGAGQMVTAGKSMVVSPPEAAPNPPPDLDFEPAPSGWANVLEAGLPRPDPVVVPSQQQPSCGIVMPRPEPEAAGRSCAVALEAADAAAPQGAREGGQPPPLAPPLLTQPVVALPPQLQNPASSPPQLQAPPPPPQVQAPAPPPPLQLLTVAPPPPLPQATSQSHPDAAGPLAECTAPARGELPRGSDDTGTGGAVQQPQQPTPATAGLRGGAGHKSVPAGPATASEGPTQGTQGSMGLAAAAKVAMTAATTAAAGPAAVRCWCRAAGERSATTAGGQVLQVPPARNPAKEAAVLSPVMASLLGAYLASNSDDGDGGCDSGDGAEQRRVGGGGGCDHFQDDAPGVPAVTPAEQPAPREVQLADGADTASAAAPCRCGCAAMEPSGSSFRPGSGSGNEEACTASPPLSVQPPPAADTAVDAVAHVAATSTASGGGDSGAAVGSNDVAGAPASPESEAGPVPYKGAGAAEDPTGGYLVRPGGGEPVGDLSAGAAATATAEMEAASCRGADGAGGGHLAVVSTAAAPAAPDAGNGEAAAAAVPAMAQKAEAAAAHGGGEAGAASDGRGTDAGGERGGTTLPPVMSSFAAALGACLTAIVCAPPLPGGGNGGGVSGPSGTLESGGGGGSAADNGRCPSAARAAGNGEGHGIEVAEEPRGRGGAEGRGEAAAAAAAAVVDEGGAIGTAIVPSPAASGTVHGCGAAIEWTADGGAALAGAGAGADGGSGTGRGGDASPARQGATDIALALMSDVAQARGEQQGQLGSPAVAERALVVVQQTKQQQPADVVAAAAAADLNLVPWPGLGVMSPPCFMPSVGEALLPSGHGCDHAQSLQLLWQLAVAFHPAALPHPLPASGEGSAWATEQLKLKVQREVQRSACATTRLEGRAQPPLPQRFYRMDDKVITQYELQALGPAVVAGFQRLHQLALAAPAVLPQLLKAPPPLPLQLSAQVQRRASRWEALTAPALCCQAAPSQQRPDGDADGNMRMEGETVAVEAAAEEPPRRMTRSSRQCQQPPRRSQSLIKENEAAQLPAAVAKQQQRPLQQRELPSGGAAPTVGAAPRAAAKAAAVTAFGNGGDGETRPKDQEMVEANRHGCDAAAAAAVAAITMDGNNVKGPRRVGVADVVEVEDPAPRRRGAAAAEAGKRGKKGAAAGGPGFGNGAVPKATAMAAAPQAERPLIIGQLEPPQPQRKRGRQEGADGAAAAKKARDAGASAAAAATAAAAEAAPPAARAGKAGKVAAVASKQAAAAAAMGMGMAMGGGGTAMSEHALALSNARDVFLTQSILVGLALNVSYTRCHEELIRRRRARAEAAAATTKAVASM